MVVQIKSPVSPASDIRARVIVFYRLPDPNRISPFAQFLFPLADMAGVMLEGLQ